MPGCGSGVLVSSSSLLIRSHHGRCQAKIPLSPLFKFAEPPLFNRRVVSRMVLRADALTAGVKLTNRLFRLRFFTTRGRNVYPRKSNFVFEYWPLRLPSLQ